MGSPVEICSCGHPRSRHMLADTEYSRCEGAHMCRCAGKFRKVAVVTGSRSSLVFRREYRVRDTGWYDTLNRAMEKAVSSPEMDAQWALTLCDCCGVLVGKDEIHTAFALINSEHELEVEMLCQLCAFERGVTFG